MNKSTHDKISGSLHEVKGTIREQLGKITSDANLESAGNAEKNMGKLQQQVGHAKTAVAKIVTKLTK